jgi:hypothetical protein
MSVEVLLIDVGGIRGQQSASFYIRFSVGQNRSIELPRPWYRASNFKELRTHITPEILVNDSIGRLWCIVRLEQDELVA